MNVYPIPDLHEARVVGEEKYGILSKHTRQVPCADKYAKFTTGHSACLPRNNNGVEPSDQQLILDAHNTARRDVTPTASNMQLMNNTKRLGWAKEKKDFTYGNNQNKSVGHYTKVMLAVMTSASSLDFHTNFLIIRI
ncbi:hypothetical protein DPMN_043115 [Dreissena polymorpha]|uniref:SCP domain-containing protein n=1 Tax=Dreissena polymorpha TaxID=45954 RepID=A0A9D4D1M4_DREPO|nr:hypothetical protein DPMN_043115 [Dreissena polymorpha]